ncbi:hypothetical protein L1887_03100 [Cichorium endivia]|nr:hypothetical protein L1887_03100 [Cichorium endivia]
MRLPRGHDSSSSSLVCRLRKSLYGLRQASRQWYAKLSSALRSKGYTHSSNDYSLFLKRMPSSIVIVAIYVDDILVTGNNEDEILNLKSFLDEQFKIKDLGLIHFFLGIEFNKISDGMVFQALHLNNKSDFKMEAFCDSDRAACPLTRRSVSGFFITLGGSPISCKSKKQVTVSLSSAEAEYRSMRRVTTELAWLTRLFTDFQLDNITPIQLKYDNLAAIYIATNPVFHERTKHIEIDCHNHREKVQDGLIRLSHVDTLDQQVDLLTNLFRDIATQKLYPSLVCFNAHQLVGVC